MKMSVLIGQDTACYWNGEVELPEHLGIDHEKITAFLTEWANSQLDPDLDNSFEPEFDFTNPRIVSASTCDRSISLSDIPLGPRYHDAGLVLTTAIQRKSLPDFLTAAEECGASRDSALEFLLAAVQQAKNADLCTRHGVRLVQAQEPEVAGRWDWLDDHGNASDMSFSTQAEAAADAVSVLRLKDAHHG